MTEFPLRFPHLFDPVRIGSMALRNRLVMSPMETMYSTPEGLPSARTIAYYEARARGGVGLITTGAACVDKQHKELPVSLHFGEDGVIEAHRALTEAVHAHGAKIQPQLAHAGPDGLAPQLHGIDSLGPSAIQNYLTRTTARALTVAELQTILDQYRAAARRIREAGYDGIELHAAHGYMLLGSFLTPWRNGRSDEYSAVRAEGRTRAIVEAVRAIKAEVGEDFPLTLRISGYERIAGGRESPDTARLAPILVEAGVDAFHVTGGVIDRFVTRMVNGAHDPDGLNVAQARAIKNAVSVPVMVVGRIHDPALAERILAEGHADLIVMGRPLLADPELPTKLQSNRAHEIRRCISCQNCIDAMETRFAMDCAVNPTTGREAELDFAPAAVSKNVVVIGSGPGGLEAARVAALRGHRVRLFERNGSLGGALVHACAVHPENEPFYHYLLAEIERLGVEVELDAEMDPDRIAALSPAADAVVVATGGRLTTPRIPGDDLRHVWTGALLRELIAGRVSTEARHLPLWIRLGARLLRPLQASLSPARIRRASRLWLPIGRRVVVIGGDLAALELAEFLAARGRSVSILEPGPAFAPEVGDKRRGEHMDRLDRAGVSLNLNVEIEAIRRDGVVLIRRGTDPIVLPADSVILAGAVEPDTRLFDALDGRVPARFAVGDCTGLGLIQKATLDGARAGCAI